MKRMAQVLLPIGAVLLLFAVYAPTASAGKEVTRFEFPDVRDDFCGIHINYQYCKCAFHDDYCDEIGLSEKTSHVYVWDEYRKWVRGVINTRGSSCELAGGIWSNSNRSCTICTSPHVKVGNTCVKEKDAEEARAELPEGPFNADCSVNKDFEDTWKKYSDIDERLGEGERSYEAGEYVKVIELIVTKKAQVFNYKVAMELDRIARLELRSLRTALIQNIKVNLLKSFWRLTYITYTTIKSGVGTGKTYVELLEKTGSVEVIAKGIKVLQANVPGDSALAIDTREVAGKVRSVGANAALEALDSLGDPIKIATQIAGDSIKATYPSADLTPQEIAILQNQHIRERAIDGAIQESYLINSQRRMNVLELEAEIAMHEAEAAQWKVKERARVADMLERSCKNQTRNN